MILLMFLALCINLEKLEKLWGRGSTSNEHFGVPINNSFDYRKDKPCIQLYG